MALFEKKYRFEDLMVGNLRHLTNYTEDDGKLGKITHEFMEYVIFTSQAIAGGYDRLVAIDGRKFSCEVSRTHDFICRLRPLASYCKDITEMSKKRYTKLDVLEIQKELTINELSKEDD